MFFFFQAEDGIRDLYVTGVQTCALPIYLDQDGKVQPNVATQWDYQDGGKTIIFTIKDGIKFSDGSDLDATAVAFNIDRILKARSEERRVGKECRSRW